MKKGPRWSLLSQPPRSPFEIAAFSFGSPTNLKLMEEGSERRGEEWAKEKHGGNGQEFMRRKQNGWDEADLGNGGIGT
jgi:hypothetical protein